MHNLLPSDASIDKAITEAISDNVQAKNRIYISEENILQYNHGDGWSHASADGQKGELGAFVEISAEFAVRAKRIAERKISTIQEFIDTITEKMHSQFARSLFEMVNESTALSGNTVNISEEAPVGDVDMPALRAMLDMSSKMELGTSKYGTVQYPSMYVHPENKRLLALVNSPIPASIQREMDLSQHKAELRAIARETVRLSRYKR